MEHLAGIFGFIGLHMWCEEGFSHWIQSCRNLLHGSAMVGFSDVFADWNLRILQGTENPAFPHPPNFAGWSMFNIEGCQTPTCRGQFGFGSDVTASKGGFLDPLGSAGFFMATRGALNPHNLVVVSMIFYFHPYFGKISNLSNIFQVGWFNHQLDNLHLPHFATMTGSPPADSRDFWGSKIPWILWDSSVESLVDLGASWIIYHTIEIKKPIPTTLPKRLRPEDFGVYQKGKDHRSNFHGHVQGFPFIRC